MYKVARFVLVQHAKTGKNIPNKYKIDQIDKTCIKWPQNIPNGRKIDHHRPLQDPLKFTQVGIFGLKI
jgi:hypothetical protein